MKWRFANIAVLILNSGLCGLAFYIWFFAPSPQAVTLGRYEYIDLSLSILNAMIALLAIILAIAAFWGYSAIREAAIIKAGEVADRVAKEVMLAYADEDQETRMLNAFGDFLRSNKEQYKNKGVSQMRRPLRAAGHPDREEGTL
jgi:hypothetical protein